MMKKHAFKLAMTGALAIASGHVIAIGFESLPTTGFSVSGETSAYRFCNTTGDLGWSIDDIDLPTSTANNTCAVFPASSTTSPVSGYSLAASRSVALNLNDAAHTNNTDIRIGTLRNYMWRNTTTNMCIFGVRLSTLTGNDYDLNTPGIQMMGIDDVAYGGFAAYNGSSAVNAGYFVTNTSGDSVAYRIGRTHTAVQYRPSSGYVTRPLTSSAPAASTSINGISTGSGIPTAAQQAAALSANWVTFTTSTYAIDPDTGLPIYDGTSLFYIEASCPSATYTTTPLANVIKFRQTGRGFGHEMIEIKAPGYVPGTGSSATTY
jgi:hypothetical protein